MQAMAIILVVLGSYLVGSLPSAYWVGRARGINIFTVGSGNMGATNVARALGTKWGLFVAIVDVFKGWIAVWLAGQSGVDQAQVLAAIYVVLGHNWSVWVLSYTGRLRGGKGAATTIGSMIAFAPAELLLLMFTLAVLVLLITRWSSLAMLVSIIAGGLAILYLAATGTLAEAWLFHPIILLPITFHRYRGNISRLIQGDERKVGERVDPVNVS